MIDALRRGRNAVRAFGRRTGFPPLGRLVRRLVGYRQVEGSGEEAGVPFVVLAVVLVVVMLAVVMVAYFLFRRW